LHESKKAIEIKPRIETTNQGIDQMVYGLSQKFNHPLSEQIPGTLSQDLNLAKKCASKENKQ
jgi:hypothetical protein